MNLIILICLFEVTIASHHFSGLVFAPLLLLATFFIMLVRKEINQQKSFRRFILFLAVGILFSVIIIYPVLFGSVTQNVHIPHETTSNYFLNLRFLDIFFLRMFGFFLILVPLTFLVVWRRWNLFPIFFLSIFFLVLGLGGTTFLPEIIFGESWLGLTYDRFNLFSGLAFMPLLGYVCVFLKRKKNGKAFLISFLVLSIIFAGWIGNYAFQYTRPKEVPVESLVNFLDNDDHWKWRYLTLGFGTNDFSKLSILTNATTLDGWYYRGRDIPELANSGVAYLSGAKYEENGIPVLKSVLENASHYHLRFVFCNDKIYEPLLNETGFRLLDEKFEQVTLWVNLDSPQLEITEIVNPNHQPTLLDYSWGIIPVAWVFFYFLFEVLKILKNRSNFSLLKKLKSYRSNNLSFQN